MSTSSAIPPDGNPVASIPVSKVLATEELLNAILCHCNDRTLGRLAVVCRAFRYTAVPILWSELENLRPLLKLLPDTKVVGGRKSRGDYFVLQRNCKLYSPDVRDLKRYAPLIRSVSLFDPTVIDSGLWAALTLQSPDGILLPNLTHLGIIMISPASDGISPNELGLLPSHKLERLFVTVEAGNGRIGEDFIDFLQVLAHLAPYIQDLRVETGEARNLSTVVDGLSELFGRLNGLRTVQLTIPDERSPTLLAPLLHLPDLEDLRIYLPPSEDQGSLFRELPPPFHGGYRGDNPMRRLEISSETLVFARILFWIGKVNVRSLTHTSHFLSTEADLAILNQSVSATSTPSLDSLTILLNSEDSLEEILVAFDDSPDDYQYNVSTFRPLLDISTLVTLKIRAFVPLFFTDEFLQEAAMAWPSLETIELCPYPLYDEKSDQVRPQITVPGVLAFVARCPRLSALGILFDASTAENVDDTSGVSPEGTRHLVTLDVGHSWIDSDAVQIVASVLGKYLPGLKRLAWHYLGEQQTLTEPNTLRGRPCLHDGGAGYRRCAEWNNVLQLLPFDVEHASGHWWGSELQALPPSYVEGSAMGMQ